MAATALIYLAMAGVVLLVPHNHELYKYLIAGCYVALALYVVPHRGRRPNAARGARDTSSRAASDVRIGHVLEVG